MSNIVKIQALFLSSFLLMFGGGLQGLLLAVRGAEEGFSTVSLGLIGTGWSIGFVAGSLYVPALVRRVGHIRTYAVMAAIGTVTILLNLLWINDFGWIVLRIFSGFCFSGAAMVVESWLNEKVDNKNRGTIFSIYVMVNLTASTIGQLAISVTGVAGYLPFVLGAISLILAIMPTALSTQPQPIPLRETKLDLPLLYKTSPIAIIACFCVGMANGTFGTLAPVFAHLQGIPATQIAYLLSVPIILGAVAQVPFGRISDKIDRRLVIIATGVLASIMGVAMVLLNPTGAMLYVTIGLYGFFAFPIHAIAVAHANDFAKDGDFSSIASGMLVTLGVGLAIGPFIASFVMDAFGPVFLFAVTAFMHATIAISAFIRMRARAPEEDREPFQPDALGKNTMAHAGILDPRAATDDEDENV